MPADIRSRLAAADPARELRPIEAGDSDLLLRSIIGATTPRVVRHRTRTHTARLLLAAALLAVLLVGAGFTAYRVAFESGTASDVRRSFATVRESVPLPPGTAWHELNIDSDGIYAGSPDRTADPGALRLEQRHHPHSKLRVGPPGVLSRSAPPAPR